MHMGSMEDNFKPNELVNGADNMLEVVKIQDENAVVRKPINSELWHACAGPLVNLPNVGSLVYYLPQGHSEQVAISTKRAASSQIPNYPNLPSQLLCQVHKVALHADKDTDEVYAQMSLQPINSEKDVFQMPHFGVKHGKHPNDFFCKTLTASDTSTYGGFSVPRRAAEKLFPQLDYSIQPPMQELIVRDLHDHTWTFRHIYRGQPKRHLLTTGWSMFVGAKRLRAGDAVLFIRDEKSQLLLGVRRVNRQHSALPSSVLSSDSMHIGILAAAAHAAANKTSFTIFYNPRACPSEFVIPLDKYRKSVYCTQLSAGMRFGMMLETEDSNKRRFMGTLVGISDLDPLRWRNSKWRSLQVEWDEPGCGDKQNRVSPWEIETSERLFTSPSVSANLKRPFHSAFTGAPLEWGDTLINRPYLGVPETSLGDLQCTTISSLWPEQLMEMHLQPNGVIAPETDAVPQEVKIMMQSVIEKPVLINQSDVLPTGESLPQIVVSLPKQMSVNKLGNQTSGATSGVSKLETIRGANHFQAPCRFNESILPLKHMNPQNIKNDFAVTNHNSDVSYSLASPWLAQSRDLKNIQTQQIEPPQVTAGSADALLHDPGTVEFNALSKLSHTYVSYRNPGILSTFEKSDQPAQSSETTHTLLHSVQDLMDPHFNVSETVFQPELPVSLQQGMPNLEYSSSGPRDLSFGIHDQSDVYSCLDLDGSNSGSTVIDDPSVSSTMLNNLCTYKNVDFHNPLDFLVKNLCSYQDIQTQVASASIEDCQNLSVQEYASNSGGTSSSNIDFDDSNLLQHSSWQQVTPLFRTYTKIQKAGSVGRSIDVSSFKNYDELRSEIEQMFGLKNLLNDTGAGWKLVYVDFENDVLLVGDDPWEEFVSCVKCIRIFSPIEVQQMGVEGMQLVNDAVMQGTDSSIPVTQCGGDGLRCFEEL